MPTQAERTKNTRTQIIETAQIIFARDGYAKAALSEIVKSAGITTGALYHHFGDKKGLFIAVAEHVEQHIIDETTRLSVKSGSVWDRFEGNITNTLEICARPDIQRIVFRDAPTVIGLHEWKEIEMKYGFGHMHKVIARLSEEKLIDAPNPSLVAHIILGSIMEAAHFVAMSRQKKRSLKEAQATIITLLRSLAI